MFKQKARLIYNLNNNNFVADVEIKYNAKDHKLSEFVLLDLQTNVDSAQALKEVKNRPSWIVRYCVDYSIGKDMSRYICKCNIRSVFYEVEHKMYKLSDQHEFYDTVFTKFTFKSMVKKKTLEDKTVWVEFSKVRSYLIATYFFSVGMTNYIKQRLG